MAKKKMKIILLDDIPTLGSKYDVKEVALGYFRNYLLPNGLAKPATEEALEELEHRREEIEKRREERVNLLKEKAQELEGEEIVFQKRASEEGKMFGSVSSRDIEEKLQEDYGLEKVAVGLEDTFKNLGEYEDVEVNFGEGVTASIDIRIETQEGIIPDTVPEDDESDSDELPYDIDEIEEEQDEEDSSDSEEEEGGGK